MRVKKCGEYLVSVFNPEPFGCVSDAMEVWNSAKRTPLVCAVSTDDGESFGLNGVVPISGKIIKVLYDELN